jgi:hypothetical protein
MAFLEDLVDCNERLESLDLVGKNWLPVNKLAPLSKLVFASRCICAPMLPPGATMTSFLRHTRNAPLVCKCGIKTGCSHIAPVCAGLNMWRTGKTYTFMPDQKLAELLWSHVYTMHARTCFPIPV